MCETSEEEIINELDKIIAGIDDGMEILTVKDSLEQLRAGISRYSLNINNGCVRNLYYHNMISLFIQRFTITVAIVGSDNSRNTATCFFIKIDDTVYAITNKHVSDFYDHKITFDSKACFQIGSYEFPIKEFIVDSNEELDLLVIKISNEYIDKLILNQGKTPFKPTNWPPSKPCKDDMLFLSGYPGVFREDGDMSSNTYFVSILEGIEDVGIYKSIINFDREKWIKGMGVKDPQQLNKVGGFSGGPAFVCRDGKLELIGVISQNGGSFFDMQIVHSLHIQKDGTISL